MGDTFAEQLGRGLDDLRRRRLDRFSARTLLWLAALPEWSDRLANQLGFAREDATTSSTLEKTLDRLAAAGLLERREVIGADGDVITAFWLPSSHRGEVGRYLQESRSSALIAAGVDALAHALEKAKNDITPAVRQWLTVARGYQADPTGRSLLRSVDELVGEATTDALGLVAAAQALGDVLGGPLASAARRAQWRVDRSYREALDAQYLAHYLPRPEVEGALTALLDGDGPWAVHLLGEAGVGKTMAIRYLSSGALLAQSSVIQSRVAKFAVARVDFDHVDPRYPDRRPAELLLALAGDLTGHTATRDAMHQMRRFDDAAHALHETLAGYSADSADRILLEEQAIDSFAAYLNELEVPVVLVLDTCEELAKLHAPGGAAPAIDRTFDMLKRIHARSEKTRVVLAGRRWLTPPPAVELDRSGGLGLRPRDYLKVVRVDGFTEWQAAAYLDQRDPEDLISTELRAAVIARCASADSGRINPFDLACYAGWALANPDLDPRVLRDLPGDPYVEQRIIGRITDTAVRDCLPVAVELGRFDRSMLERPLNRRRIDLTTAFTGLASQEWVTIARYDADGQPQVIEIDEHLRARIRTVVAADPSRFPLNRSQLGLDLAQLIMTTPVERLPAEALESVIRLSRPEDAAQLWARLEARIAKADAWAWAAQVAPRAAAAEAERAENGPTILAAIRATHAAATLRIPGRPGLAALWEEVRQAAGRHPDPEMAKVLEARATCGLVAAGHLDDEALLDKLGRWSDLSPNLPCASRLAALETVITAGRPVPGGSAILDELVEEAPDDVVRAAALLLRAADHVSDSPPDGALPDVEEALSLAERLERSGGGALDWVSPARLLDRARLARVQLALLCHEPPEALPLAAWREASLSQVADIDAERLVSATILLEAAWGVVGPGMIGRVAAAETYVPERQPIATWHHLTPALCPTLALELAHVGNMPLAAAALRHRREASVSHGEDPNTITVCDEMLIRLSRLARTTTLTTSVHRLGHEGTPETRTQAWALLALVKGESPPSPELAGGMHAWWQAQIGRPQRLVAWPEFGARLTAESVDAEEARLLRGEPVSAALRGQLHDTPPTPDALPALLRASALLDDIPPYVGGLPPRRVAETALAEGEMLALRLPEPATLLLELAADRFNAAGDTLGELRALVLLTITRAKARLVPGHPEALDSYRVSINDLGEGWPRRFALARDLLHGAAIAERSAVSPELGLRPPQSPSPPPPQNRPARLAQTVASSAGFLGVWAARRWWLRRRQPDALGTQETLGFSLSGDRAYWFRCRVSPATNGLRIERYGQLMPVGVAPDPPVVFSSSWPYVLIPILEESVSVEEDRWEQLLTTRLPDLRELRPLWIRLTGRLPREQSWTIPQVGSTDFWRNSGAEFHGPWSLERFTSVSSSAVTRRDPPDRRLVHIVGTPVTTKAGWRFRVGDVLSEREQRVSRSKAAGERLFSGDDLGSRKTALLVLQAEPVDGPPRPLADLRVGMIQLARALVAGEVSAVLIVPPLPDTLAAEVASRIWRFADSAPSRYESEQVFNLVDKLRTVVARREEPTPAAPADRAAPDFLLFM